MEGCFAILHQSSSVEGTEMTTPTPHAEPVDWRKQLNDENDPDPDDDLLDETPGEVIAEIGFDPLDLPD
jgi:hypothetical protein